MRLCSYVVKHDTGFAPNPFWGYCTLTACTPNHMGVKLGQGDWILGHGSAKEGNRIIYVMEVAERILFDHYYRHSRFRQKRPAVGGTWRKRCGDNMYFLDAGKWRQDPRAQFHTSPEEVEKDLRFPFAYASEHFYYFGEAAVEMPRGFSSLLQRCQGCSCKHSLEAVQGFLQWLQSNFDRGIKGLPKHRRVAPCIESGNREPDANAR